MTKSSLGDADKAYKTACDLAGKNYARVSFEFDGTTYTVEPTRLARKITDQHALLKEAYDRIDNISVHIGYLAAGAEKDKKETREFLTELKQAIGG